MIFSSMFTKIRDITFLKILLHCLSPYMYAPKEMKKLLLHILRIANKNKIFKRKNLLIPWTCKNSSKNSLKCLLKYNIFKKNVLWNNILHFLFVASKNSIFFILTITNEFITTEIFPINFIYSILECIQNWIYLIFLEHGKYEWMMMNMNEKDSKIM